MDQKTYKFKYPNIDREAYIKQLKMVSGQYRIQADILNGRAEEIDKLVILLETDLLEVEKENA